MGVVHGRRPRRVRCNCRRFTNHGGKDGGPALDGNESHQRMRHIQRQTNGKHGQDDSVDAMYGGAGGCTPEPLHVHDKLAQIRQRDRHPQCQRARRPSRELSGWTEMETGREPGRGE